MGQTQKRRALVVEDDRDMLDFFVEGIKTLDVDVDAATSKPEAIEKVNCRAYHVAMVDIMLTDSHADRGGFDVISHINDRDEGTKIVVASATSDVTVPAELIDKGITKYLVKKHHIRKREDFLGPIRDALESANLKLFGDCRDLKTYLAMPEPFDIWVYTLTYNLDIKQTEAEDILQSIFWPLLPMTRRKGQQECLCFNVDKTALYGIFWSRATGTAVWISIGKDEGLLVEPPAELGSSEFFIKNNYHHVKSKTWRLFEPKRSDFLDRMKYEPKKAQAVKRGLH